METLEGSHVRLEPLRAEHAALFWNVASDSLDDIFRWFPYAMKTEADFVILGQFVGNQGQLEWYF